MKLELTASKIWMATEPVDFRKGLNGLSELIATHFGRGLGSHLYVFYNRRKNNLSALRIIATEQYCFVSNYKRNDLLYQLILPV